MNRSQSASPINIGEPVVWRVRRWLKRGERGQERKEGRWGEGSYFYAHAAIHVACATGAGERARDVRSSCENIQQSNVRGVVSRVAQLEKLLETEKLLGIFVRC